MNKLICLIFLFTSSILSAQDITGIWSGALQLPQGQLPLNINISTNGNGYTATMESPSQGAKDIPVNMVTFENNTLVFTVSVANISYKGTFAGSSFKGIFTQNSNSYPLNFSKGELSKKPQEPVKPYPYHTEEVTFTNEKAGITLAGTLTLPKKEGNFPAVILITGSGGQNRDEELVGHKPFLVLADHLTRNGIAVLRYDDRGVGASQGVFETATTANFATDTEAAFNYLRNRKEINKKKIGLAGHSEGGTIASIVAAGNTDIAFIVLMAGGNIPGDELMMLQNYLLGKAQGMPEEELTKLGTINRKVYDAIKQETDTAKMKTKLLQVMDSELKPLLISKGIPQEQVSQYIDVQVSGLTSPWYIGFIKHNPAPFLEKVKCPILAINGDKDVQVAPVANLDAVKRAGEKNGNKKVTVKQLPGLNHLFQESETGLPEEYGTIEQTIAPAALNEISGWIIKQVK